MPKRWTAREGAGVELVSRHARIEWGFRAWAAAVCRRPIWTLATLLLLTVYLAAWIPQMRFDNSTQSFLRRDDPARIAYEDFRARFGQDDFVLVAVRPPNLFDLGFLERLRELHDALEQHVPHLEDVTSMINARTTWGRDNELVVEELFESWPQTPEALERIRARALTDPLYRNLLFSRDFTYTTITVRPVVYSEVERVDELAGFDEGPAGGAPLSDPEIEAFLAAIYDVVGQFEGPAFETQIVGSAITNQSLNRALEHDVTMFVTGAIAVMGLILFMLFRSWAGVVLPLLVVILSLLSSLGVMVIMGIPASITLQLIPILLLAIGVCNAVHVLTLMHQRMSDGLSKHAAIVSSLEHAGLPMFMCNLTTASGFLSFISADLAPVAHLGVVAPIAIVLVLVYTLTLLPALLMLAPLRWTGDSSRRRVEIEIGALLSRSGGFAVRHPWSILAGAALCAAVSIVGVLKLEVAQNVIRWFPRDDVARSAQELLDREFGGTATLEVVIDSGLTEGLYDPDFLRRLLDASEFALHYEHGGIVAGKAISILDVLRATHQSLNENRPEMYQIPQDRQLIAQELLLFENAGSDDLQELVDTQLRLARLSLRVPLADAILYEDYVQGLDAGLRRILGPDVRIEMTGIMQLLTRTMAGVVFSLISSYATALLVITPLMVLLIGTLRLGLMAMIPNLLPVLMTLGVMGWMKIPIDMSSMLVGGLIIGLAVDDTIHFMHKFQAHHAELGDIHAAIQASMQSVGAALLFTSLILGAGFVVMEFAYMRNAAQFGQLACFAVVAAFAADVLLAPALLALVGDRRIKGSAGPGVVRPALDRHARSDALAAAGSSTQAD